MNGFNKVHQIICQLESAVRLKPYLPNSTHVAKISPNRILYGTTGGYIKTGKLMRTKRSGQIANYSVQSTTCRAIFIGPVAIEYFWKCSIHILGSVTFYINLELMTEFSEYTLYYAS